MKKFVIILGIISIVGISGSFQSIYSEDDLHSVIEIFESDHAVKLVTTQDTNWQIYLQLIVRNADGQLVNITESTAYGSMIPHRISEHVFETLMDEKGIITIDDINYEKAQWKFTPTLEQRFVGLYPIYTEIPLNLVSKPGDDTEIMYGSKKDHSMWKIHYCAIFEPLGYQCIPVFQALVPNMTIEPTDTVEQQWTILRQLD